MFQWLKKYRAKILAVGGYVVYTVVLTLFFLFLTFPYGRMERALLSWINLNTPIRVSVGQGSFLFPVGFQYDRATVEILFHGNRETVQVEELQCRVRLYSVIQAKVNGVCLMDVFGGNFRGEFQMHGLEAQRRYYMTTEGKDLNLGFLKGFTGEINLGGKASIFFDNSWQNKNFMRGNGNVSIQLTDVSIQNLNINGFPVDPMSASEATSRIILEGGKGTVEEIRVNGDLMDIEGTGNFLLRTPAASSLVNLNLSVLFKGKLAENDMLYLLNPSKKKGETFRVTGKGTLDRIQWFFDGMSLTPHISP